jgi:DNA-binding NtrC family response regulator
MRTTPRRILVVDDDPTIRAVLRQTLDRQGYTVFTAAEPVAAFALLDVQPVDMVISDNLMPNMSGVSFLSMVRDGFPEVIRILLTGNADAETAIRAINEGAIYKFLTKPWDPVAMRVMLEAAFLTLDRDREHKRQLLQARSYADRLIVQG